MSEARKVRCSFYLRTEVTGGFRYDMLPVRSWSGSVYQPTEHPPPVGDFVSLPTGSVKVLARSWLYPMYGSRNWPYGEREPREGPLLTVIVEDAEGPFVDEVESENDESGSTAVSEDSSEPTV